MFRYYCAIVTSILLTMLFTSGLQAEDTAGRKPELLASQAQEVFSKYCFICHGKDSSRKGGIDYILKPAELIDNGYVLPGSAGDSLVYQRMNSGDEPMPPKDADPKAYPRPSAEEIVTVRLWINSLKDVAAGVAVATKVEPEIPAKFVSIEETNIAMRRFLESQPARSRQNWRFFSVTNLHNLHAFGKASSSDLAYARAALSKALNSLVWIADIVVPEAVDEQATILAVDLRALGWSHQKEWTELMRAYPYGLDHSQLPESRESRDAAAAIQAMTAAELPILRADWFVAVATRPPLYENLLRLPKTDRELEKRLKVDVAANILDGRARRAGFMNSNVSKNANRMVERHPAEYGAYWKSYDFFAGSDRSNLLQFPLGPEFNETPFPAAAFRHDGGEIIFHLPNGLQGYLLVKASGETIPEGPATLVSDEKLVSGSPVIVNGISCMACHKHGMIRRFSDEVREGTRLKGDAMDLVSHLYMAEEELQRVLDRDEERFVRALEQTIGPFLQRGADKDKPIKAFAEPITPVASNYNNGAVSLEHAAAELGVSNPEDLLQTLKRDPEFKALGLAPLVNGQSVKRDFWQRVYQPTARRLELGVPRRLTSNAAAK